MPDTPYFSVFTPTFNRGYILPRVYQCLRQQTFQSFEWVIIDDGSTDETSEMVAAWKKEASFPIKYVWQENQGKHIAYNTAAQLITGTLFTSIDSDDEIVPHALEVMRCRWEALPTGQRSRVSGMMFVSMDQHGNRIGDLFPEDGYVCDLMELVMVKKIRGEKGGFMQSSVFKLYPFPESVKNVYVPETVFIQQMARDWKTVCINDILRIYWVDEREDHLGDQMKTRKNYPGDRLNSLAVLNYTMRLFSKIPKTILANAVLYSKISLISGIGIRKQFNELLHVRAKLVWLLGLPLGFLLYLKEK